MAYVLDAHSDVDPSRVATSRMRFELSAGNAHAAVTDYLHPLTLSGKLALVLATAGGQSRSVELEPHTATD